MKFQSILSASSKLWNFEYVRVKAVTVACTITQREKKKNKTMKFLFVSAYCWEIQGKICLSASLVTKANYAQRI